VAVLEMTGGPIDGIGGNEALAGIGNLFENSRSYLMWALSARREKFAVAPGAENDAGPLSAAASQKMTGWSHAFCDLVGLTDPTTISCLPIRTSVPVAPWRTGRVTFLGDAIHSMTPYRGIGANVALKDAARPTRALVAANAASAA
jgi:salicylate hydroxylase